MFQSILRISMVQAMSGFPRSTLYLRISQGLWPGPVKLGVRAAGWPSAEVEAVVAALIAGKTDAEIRNLVSNLKERRSQPDSALGSSINEHQLS